MYGIASAPAIWQRQMEVILQGINGVSVFLDDIKITGPDDETHLRRLEEVLRRLNQNDEVPFKWTRQCEESFDDVKRQMQAEKCLARYSPELPLLLATDASPYGVGAVLSHLMPDGTERPIQFASQTLNRVQQNYMQFLYGRKFTLITDNRAISKIFGEHKGLPVMSAIRMQHYATYLQLFDYTIRFRKSKNHANADAMSRIPLPQKEPENVIEEADVIELNQIETLPLTAAELAQATSEDESVRNLVQRIKIFPTILANERCHTQDGGTVPPINERTGRTLRANLQTKIESLEVSDITVQFTDREQIADLPKDVAPRRQIRSRIDLMLPKNEIRHASDLTVEELHDGDRVRVRDFLSRDKWKFGRIVEKAGKLRYTVRLDDGRLWERHVDYIVGVGAHLPEDLVNTPREVVDTERAFLTVPATSPVARAPEYTGQVSVGQRPVTPSQPSESLTDIVPELIAGPSTTTAIKPADEPLRGSKRSIKVPQRLNL
ncbi:uncharacterized protein LOC129717057 [Wyeomyia smithii]|uniref:uncharacterized protein LOC129717057 n=1 Tax=Wyeomyia smithii TaxID=174621 RepID=UPI0024681D0F|nr:uncharacterized protein LOC129717057 [Wyeomyia smithii]